MASKIVDLEEIQLIVATISAAVIKFYEKYGFKIILTEAKALKLDYAYGDAHHMVTDVSVNSN